MKDTKNLILNLDAQISIDRTEFCKQPDIDYSLAYYII